MVLELGEEGRDLFPNFNPPVQQLRGQLLSQAPVATPAKRKSSIGRANRKQKKPRRAALADGEEEEEEEEDGEVADTDPEEVARPSKRARGGKGSSGKGSSGKANKGSGKAGKASAGKRGRLPLSPGGSDDKAGPSQPHRTQQPPLALHASQHNHRQQQQLSVGGAVPSQQANGWAHGGSSDSEDDFRVSWCLELRWRCVVWFSCCSCCCCCCCSCW